MISGSATQAPSFVPIFCKAGDWALGSGTPPPGAGEGIGRFTCVLQNPGTIAGCTAIYLPTTPSQLPSPEAVTTHVTNSLCIFPEAVSEYISPYLHVPHPHIMLTLVHIHSLINILLRSLHFCTHRLKPWGRFTSLLHLVTMS